MRAVTGSVVSSKPISLSKAAAVLSRFAANENASRPEVAAFVHRAAAAFDELVLFHREIRTARRRPELEKSLIEEKDKEDERKKKKRKRSGDEEAEADDDKTQRAQSNGDIGNADLRGFEAEHGSHGDKSKKRRRKFDVEERTELVAETAKNLASVRNLVENGQHYEDAVKLAENENAGKKKKKKMMVETEEMSNLDRKREPKPALEEESQRNKKKKDQEKHKRNPKEVILEISDKRQINTFGSIGEELGGVKDQKEQIMKKKKKHYN